MPDRIQQETESAGPDECPNGGHLLAECASRCTTESADTPECPLGYPQQQLKAILGDRFAEFARWSRGSTAAICDGRRYDHDARAYEPTECASNPHGVVVYPWDVAQFNRGGRPLD